MKFSVARLAKLLRPKYRLRTLFAFVTLAAVACWMVVEWPGWQRVFQIRQARGRISQYERTVAGDGDSGKAHPELVAILGDSRLKHWGSVSQVENAPGDRLPQLYAVVFSPDSKQVFTADGLGKVRSWDLSTGKETAPARQFVGPADHATLDSGGQLDFAGWEIDGQRQLESSAVPTSASSLSVRYADSPLSGQESNGASEYKLALLSAVGQFDGLGAGQYQAKRRR